MQKVKWIGETVTVALEGGDNDREKVLAMDGTGLTTETARRVYFYPWAQVRLLRKDKPSAQAGGAPASPDVSDEEADFRGMLKRELSVLGVDYGKDESTDSLRKKCREAAAARAAGAPGEAV